MKTLPLATPRGRPPAAPEQTSAIQGVDVESLRAELESSVSGEVRFDRGSLALYANDSSNFRQVPVGVVIPKRTDDGVATHVACARHGVPIVNRGGGTSLSGETVNNAVVI